MAGAACEQSVQFPTDQNFGPALCQLYRKRIFVLGHAAAGRTAGIDPPRVVQGTDSGRHRQDSERNIIIASFSRTDPEGGTITCLFDTSAESIPPLTPNRLV